MMTQSNMDLVSYGIWAGIGLIVARQVWESLRPVKGRGLKILLGDIQLAAAIPWIISIFAKRGSLLDLILPIMIGILCALPQIIGTKFIVGSDGNIRFNRHAFFYLAIVTIPLLRYAMRKYFFEHHLIFMPGSQVPDIQLMIAMYVTLIVVNTFAWRIGSFTKLHHLKKKAMQSTGKSRSAQLTEQKY
jgi:hypothetical protein